MTHDPMMARVMAAIADQSDDVLARRERFKALWREIGDEGDALHRCTLAHYAADVEDDPAEALVWNMRSLAAAERLTDERLQTTFPALSVASFLPSLHLNLAEDYRRLGDRHNAGRHVDAAEAGLDVLADDGYGAMIRRGLARMRSELVRS